MKNGLFRFHVISLWANEVLLGRGVRGHVEDLDLGTEGLWTLEFWVEGTAADEPAGDEVRSRENLDLGVDGTWGGEDLDGRGLCLMRQRGCLEDLVLVWAVLGP